MTHDAAVPRRIVGYHRDELGDWVAELECGHGQHVRHDPPWQVRPWVTTEAGRAEHLGSVLRCVGCITEPPSTSPDRIMPFEHDLTAGILRLRMSGQYTSAEVRAAFEAAVDSVPAGELRGLLLDVSESGVLATREAVHIRDMGAFLGRHAARYGSRLALVGGSDLAYGLMRLAAASVPDSQAQTEVFRDAGSALAWLVSGSPRQLDDD